MAAWDRQGTLLSIAVKQQRQWTFSPPLVVAWKVARAST
jgi:hypothetical protein